MLYLTYSLDILILLFLPIALGVFLVRKYDLEGRWWWIGAMVYIVSQVILQPVQNYLFNPFLNNLNSSAKFPSIVVLVFGGLVLGLLVGVVEGLLQYGMFRWWAKDARSFESGLLVGAGYGGAASIALAFLVLYNFVNMAIVRNLDLSTLAPADQALIMQAQITAFWSAPWFYTLREAIGQLFALTIQICLAVMILQSLIRKQWYWVLLAVGFHFLVEAARVIALNLSGEYMMNAVLGIFAVFSVLIILALRHPKAQVSKLPATLGQVAPSDHIGN
jgi:uncharacterized membrane protein YhfC